ncbi:MAG: group III truncated hemoglobin [Saprospiraceae bacterium]|nr:group III truncated hemoglobin [Saprospiraceae bacterium]
MSNIKKKKSDIVDLKDIKLLVDRFYERVREDNLLGEIFNNVIGDRWPEHLQKMYSFWQTILLEEHTYYGSPFPPHAVLPVGEAHFDRWMDLFIETVDLNFTGDKANEAKWRAGKMAEMFAVKIEYFRNTNLKPIE